MPPSNQGRHPHGRNDAPSNRAPLVPPSKNAPSRRKLFQTGRSGALSERMGANWDTDSANSFRDCTTCCEVAPSRSAIAPNGTKGCLSPNGAMHAMGRRDAPSEANRHYAGRRGVSAANGRGSPVLTPRQTGGSPCVNAAAKLGCDKTPTNEPCPQRTNRHAAANKRVPYVNATAVLGCAQMRSKQAPAPPTQPNQPQNESQR